jgi:hypothetical protein
MLASSFRPDSQAEGIRQRSASRPQGVAMMTVLQSIMIAAAIAIVVINLIALGLFALAAYHNRKNRGND